MLITRSVGSSTSGPARRGDHSGHTQKATSGTDASAMDRDLTRSAAAAMASRAMPAWNTNVRTMNAPQPMARWPPGSNGQM